MKNIIISSLAAIVLVACGGGGGGGSANSSANSSPPIIAPALAHTSYENFKQVGLTPQALPSGDNMVRAYGDFAGNGRLDLFRAVITYDSTQPISSATPSVFEYWSRQADGSLVKNTTLLASAVGCLHPRKALVADFNGDGRADVFVACHGYDASPFPGERNKVVLSQPGGTYQISDASTDVGFWHGASAADLNGDGHIDLVLVNNFDTNRAISMLNDGSGHFVREATSRMPQSMVNQGGFFSIELVDINEDARLDLIVGGHEWENAPTWIFINPGTNNFSAVTPVTIPSVPNEGVVLDFSVTGSGANRSLWIVRTSGGDGTFYRSRTVQKVSYPSLVSSVVLQERPATWIRWLVPATVNGASVVVSDDASDNLSFSQ